MSNLLNGLLDDILDDSPQAKGEFSPQFAQNSPFENTAASRVVAGFSPNSPLSPAINGFQDSPNPPKTIEQLAAGIANALGTTPEFCLSLLDDSDIEAITSGSDPDRLNAWKGFASLSLEPPPPSPPQDGDPLTVVSWTPAGRPVLIHADSPGHAEWIRRWNPAPTKGAKP